MRSLFCVFLDSHLESLRKHPADSAIKSVLLLGIEELSTTPTEQAQHEKHSTPLASTRSDIAIESLLVFFAIGFPNCS